MTTQPKQAEPNLFGLAKESPQAFFVRGMSLVATQPMQKPKFRTATVSVGYLPRVYQLTPGPGATVH